MALQINAQSFVDQMVRNMQRTDLDERAELAIEVQFDQIIQEAIALHQKAIDDQMAKPAADQRNQAIIAYHEKRIARYAR